MKSFATPTTVEEVVDSATDEDDMDMAEDTIEAQRLRLVD